MNDEALLDSAIDETETVTTAASSSVSSEAEDLTNEWFIERKELEEIKLIDDYLLEVHGIAPGKKRDGITRLIYENLNGVNNILTGNDKLDKARQVINDLGADIVAYNEHRLNLRHKSNVKLLLFT